MFSQEQTWMSSGLLDYWERRWSCEPAWSTLTLLTVPQKGSLTWLWTWSRKHTHVLLPEHPPIPGTDLKWLPYLSLASFHSSVTAFLLGFSPSLLLPTPFNYLVYFWPFIIFSPSLSFFFLLSASSGRQEPFSCTLCMHSSSMLSQILQDSLCFCIDLFFFLGQDRI